VRRAAADRIFMGLPRRLEPRRSCGYEQRSQPGSKVCQCRVVEERPLVAEAAPTTRSTAVPIPLLSYSTNLSEVVK